MLKKTDEIKVMRDPIHGYIHVNLQVVWDCINAKEMQRLRRIHQLGGDYQVYHTAEHSRFAHSLGVYEIVRRMVEEVDDLKGLSEFDKATVMLAGLLHDVGHGPFSHAFEAVSSVHHEEFTRRIIVENSEIHEILAAVDENLPEAVASIITYEHPNDILNQIVSGQLDADRMDYLLRDAYFTGTSYGNFDLERIIRTIRVKDHRIVVKESGIHSVEDYIMARYHMYWQVYLHPAARSYEGLLYLLFKRMKDAYQKDNHVMDECPMFIPFLKNEDITIDEMFILDEAAALYGFSCLRNSKDPILKDLASRILDRRLFEYRSGENEIERNKIREKVQQAGYDLRYYIYEDEVMPLPYMPYHTLDEGHNIWVYCEDKEVRELSDVSAIVRAVSSAKVKADRKIYYPKEIGI